MSDRTLRRMAHEKHFTAEELKSLGILMMRLDCHIEDFTRSTLSCFLELFYSVPAEKRGDKQVVIWNLMLAKQMLLIVRREDLTDVLGDECFRRSFIRLLGGRELGGEKSLYEGMSEIIEAMILTASTRVAT